jgi:CoA:oxalate CoA-transferase
VLEHLRIIELGQVIAGTFGDMILSDLGANVIKVEPPAGDPGRRSAIYSIREESAIHVMHNRNKKSIVLDLKTEGGRQTLFDLVRSADAVVENFRPGVLTRLGVDYDRMREANPEIILVSISGFGLDSPYRDLPAYDLILQAMTGHMSIMGEPGRPPVIMGIPIADLLAGLFAALAILVGVEGRRQHGRGEHFDLAMFDVMVEMLAHVGTLYLNSGLDQQPQGSAHPFITPWQAFRCRDGVYIVVAPREEHFWTRLCEAIGRPDLAQRPEFADARSRQARRDELLPLLEEVFLGKDAGEWLEILRTWGVPAALVNRMPAVFEDPHVSARQMIQSFRMRDGIMHAVGNAIKIAGRPERPSTPPPSLGGDTEEILLSLLDYGPERIAQLEREGVFGGPLPKPASS